MTHTSATRDSNNSLMAALAQEANLPALCFSINASGGIREEFEIALNHPLTHGDPALFVGEYYITSDRMNGCLYRPHGDVGHVRRAYLKEFTTALGKTRRVLARSTDNNMPRLLHVCFKLPDNIILKLNFFTGGWGSAKREAADNGEALFSFNDGDFLFLFYPDGRVRQVEWNGTDWEETSMSVLEMAQVRICRVQENIEHTLPQIDDHERRVRATDKLLYEVVAVLAASRYNAEVRELALKTLYDAAADKLLRQDSGVHKAAEEVMARLNETEGGFALRESFNAAPATPMRDRSQRPRPSRQEVEARRVANRIERLKAQGKYVEPTKGGGKKNKNTGKKRH